MAAAVPVVGAVAAFSAAACGATPGVVSAAGLKVMVVIPRPVLFSM